MLKQRIITALILTAIFLSMLFGVNLWFDGALYFSCFIACVLLIGAWEWAKLSGYNNPWQRILYVVAMAILLLVTACFIELTCFIDLNSSHQQALYFAGIKSILLVGCAWWALALLLVQGYPSSAILWGHKMLRLFMGVLVLVPTWVALVYLRFQPQGAWLVLMMIGIVAVADIGGYFTGRRFGKHKLAPAVSPGKTLEGFLGGLVSNLILAIGVSYFGQISLPILLAIVIPTSLFSVLGDLLESMLKRHQGIKDSGSILPGHGGILDRVDSITAAAPVFALCLLASGWGLGQ
jgi:phosphatidate cytidylyltransferase